jgi:hypothetical protein
LSRTDITDTLTGAALYAFVLIYDVFIVTPVDGGRRAFIEAIVATNAIITDNIPYLSFSSLGIRNQSRHIHNKWRSDCRGTHDHELSSAQI